MNDTAPSVRARARDLHSAMTAAERFRAAAAMHRVAIRVVDSSLPTGLVGPDRRRAILLRFYGDTLPAAAVDACANWRPSY